MKPKLRVIHKPKSIACRAKVHAAVAYRLSTNSSSHEDQNEEEADEDDEEDDAILLLGAIKNSKPSLPTHVLSRVGDIKKAQNLYNDIVERGVLPDVVTYSTLIDGYSKASCMQDALEVLHSMIERGILPDVVTYTTLIAGYCKEGEMKKAMKLHNEMIDRGMVPDPITYLVLSHGLCKVDNVQEEDDTVIENRAAV